MSDEALVGTIVSRKRGENTVGIVIQSDNLERAKSNERKQANSDGNYLNMVAVQWYDRDDERLEEVIEENMEKGAGPVYHSAINYIKNNYEEGNVGWHKKGALLVVLEGPEGDE